MQRLKVRRRPGQLPAHQHRKQSADHHERQTQEQKLDPDDLVVRREDVLLQKADFVMGMSMLTMSCVRKWMWNCGHSSISKSTGCSRLDPLGTGLKPVLQNARLL